MEPMMPTTAAAMAEALENRRLRAGMHRLLDSLRDWVRVSPRDEDAKMPDHDVMWVTDIGRGPELAILEAIKMTPELWSAAIPTNCCIVHRETLAKYVGADAAEYMAGYGSMAVEDQAARCRHEADLRAERERYGKQI